MLVLRLVKLLTHCAAHHRPTTVQLKQGIVAARVVSALQPWDATEWRNWCASSTRATAGSVKRGVLVRRVKKWAKKNPRRSKRVRHAKRTVFTLRKGLNLLKRVKKAMRA